MGWYDSYDGEQLKVGPCEFAYYKVGDAAPLPNGLYIGYHSVIVMDNGKFVASIPIGEIYDKWGKQILIDINDRSPIKLAVEEEIRRQEEKRKK